MISSLDNIKLWHAKASNEDYVSKFIFEYLAFISCLMKHMQLDIDVKGKLKDRTVIQCLKRNEDIKKEYIYIVSAGVNFEAVPVEKEWFGDDTGNSGWLSIKPKSNELRCSWHRIGTILGKAHKQQHEIFDNSMWWNCSTHELDCKEENKSFGVRTIGSIWSNFGAV